MKVEISKLKKGSSELTPECRELIERISKCSTRKELLNFLDSVTIWTYGKCELHYWIDILDKFDVILCEAATKEIGNEFLLNCDTKFSIEDTQLLLLVLNFTTLLIEHSFSRHLYNSVEHLTHLISSQNMDIVLAVLNLLYMFSKRSNFIPRLPYDKKDILLIKLFNIAERWGDPNYGLALIDCCLRKPKFEYLYQLLVEYIDENGQIASLEIPDMMDLCKNSPPFETVNVICNQMTNPTDAAKMRIAHRACLVSGFNDYALRLQFVQARLQAISVLIYSNALYDNVDKILYPGFGEELCELIDKEDVKLVEIRAAVLRTLTSILHFDRNPNVPRPGTRLPKIIQYTGAEQQGGILPLLVRDCIFNLTQNGSSEKYPLILATSLFSLLYHLASYETGGQSLIKSGMMQILLRVIGWIGDDIEHITFVTRAVRVIDLITNIDIIKFHQCNGLSIFIDRLDKEVKLCKDMIAKCHDTCESNTLKSSSLSMKFTEHEECKLDDLENMETNTESKSVDSDNNIEELKDNFENGLGSSTNSVSSRSIINPNKTEQSLLTSYYSVHKSEKNLIGKVSTPKNKKRLTCITQRAALLKSMLNFLKKSIQDHAHFNGMRNIMESSLPCALRHIISNAEFYGPSLFLLATDVVTVYVFNEPSLLSSLQDLGITNVILRSLLQKDVPATREVLGSLPNVFSALCLNERGLIEFMSYNPFDKLLKVLLSPNYLIAMRRRRSSDPLGDTATNLGNAMDDLMKHHPYLRSDATEAIVRLLNELVRLGTESNFICWRANKEINSVHSNSQNSRLTTDVANTTQNDAVCILEATENQNESSAEDDDDDEEMSSASQQHIQSQNRSSILNQQEQLVCNLHEREAIPLIDYIINVMKFIEAIFSNSSNGEYCKEFVLHGGLNPLLNMLSLPNLPVDSPVTTTAQAVANVCKSILNLTNETLVIDSALQQLSAIMNKLTPLTEEFRFQSVSVLLTELLNCPKIDDGFSIANYTPLLHRMSSVHGYVVMLVNLCRNSSNEMRSMLLKRWGSNCETGICLLQNLVKLYISLVWESTILLSLCSDDVSNNVDLNYWENYCLSSENFKDCGELALKTNFIKTKFKPEEKLRYIKSLLAASSRLGRALAELFGTLVKLSVGTPQSRQRRNNDYVTSISSSKYPTHDAKEIARILSSILVNGFTHETTSESIPKLKLTFLICSVGFTGPMLFDDKRSSFHLMISQFCEENGLKAFFDMFYWALSLNCQSSLYSFEQCCAQKNILENSECDVKDFPDGTGEFLDAWLQLLEKMINPRSILESPYSISKRFPHAQESVQFEPIFYLIQMHRLAIQIIKRIWQKRPIANFGVSMTETMINIIKHIIKSHSSLCEKYQLRLAEIKNSSIAMEQCKQSSKADMRESTINGDHLKTLIDMGFCRDHVIKALRNTRSLEQATEYLLNHSEHEIIIPLTRETQGLNDERRNCNVNRDVMDVDISECADLPCSTSNIAKNYFFNVNLISHDTIKQFCEEAIERSFSFMEHLPETIQVGSELIAIIFRHYNQEDKQTFILNIVKQLNECVDNFVRNLKTGCDLNIDKFEEYLSDSNTNTLFIRLKVTILLLDEIYTDIRKDICAAILKEHTLNSLLLLLTKTETLLQNQVTLGVKPTPPRWLQNLFELIDVIDSVSLILQRKSNMRAVSTDIWKWYDASTGKWNSYSEPNNTVIKNAFNTGERSVSVNIGRQRYTINFNCMTQVSEASGSHRPVLPVLKITQALNTFYGGTISNKIESVLTRIIRSKTDGRSTFHQDEEIYLNSLINFDSDENSKSKILDSENDKNTKTDTSQSPSILPEDFNNHMFIRNNLPNSNKYKERNEKKTLTSSLKRVQKIVLNEENIGLAKYDATEIIKCCVRLLNPLLLLSYEVKQSILKLCARLTREYENAKLFYKHGGLNILLNMHQPCNVMGYPTYAIVIIRHMIEAPSVLQESMERIIASRTFQSVPVGHRDLTFVLTQISSAVGRHPSIFLAAAKQILHADYVNNPISSLDDSRFLVKSQSSQRKCNISTDKVEDGLHSQISTNVIKDILNSLIQPCIHYTNSLCKSKSSLFHSQVTEVLLSPTGDCSIDITKKNTKKIEWCCCSWHTPSSGHTHLKPLLPRATLMKILADAIRSYQSVVPQIIVDHRCYSTDSILIKKEQSFLSFILDNYLPIVNRGQDSEVCMMSRVLISSLSDCCGQPYIQTKVVEEIQDAIIRTLSIKDPYVKNRRIQILISLFPMMIENPMQANKIHTQRNNMNRILLRKGIMTILSKLIQYKDLANSNILLTMYSILKPMEMLLRLTVAPGSLSSKRILIGTGENLNVNRRIFPRLTTRLSSNSGSIGGENVLRDIIRNVLSDRRHGFDFIFNADDLLINSQVEDIRTLRSTGEAENNENLHSSATTNHRPQVTFDRLWDDLLQNENLRLLNQNSNLNISSVVNNTVPVSTRFHNTSSEPSNNGSRRNGGSDGASSSSETVAVVPDNATSPAEVSTSESETDSNISSENDDQNDEDDDEDDDNEDETNIDDTEDPNEADADDETRQFIEVFDHIYEPESSEATSNDADIDADDEASEIITRSNIMDHNTLSVRNTRLGVTDNNQLLIRSDGQNNTSTIDEVLAAPSSLLSNDSVMPRSIIHNNSINFQLNSVRTMPASVLVSPRLTHIDTEIYSNYRDNTDEEINDGNTIDESNNIRLQHDNTVAPPVQLTPNNSNLIGSNGQRRDQSRRLIYLDQQYCISMPSINNPLDEGQIEVFNQDALHWWLEEAKLLDLESQTDACLYAAHFLKIYLIKQLQQMAIKKKSEMNANVNCLSSRRSAIPVLIQHSANTSQETHPQATSLTIDVSPNLNNIAIETEENEAPLNTTFDFSTLENDNNVQNAANAVETIDAVTVNADDFCSNLSNVAENGSEHRDHQNENLMTENGPNSTFNIENNSASITENSHNRQNVTATVCIPEDVSIEISNEQDHSTQPSEDNVPLLSGSETREQVVNEISPEVRAALGDLVVPDGVDPSFLAALPSEMREEVIQEHLRMQRSRQRAQQNAIQVAHDCILEVNPEFLAALPPNIQSEVLLQQRIEQQRQAAQSVNPDDPVDAAAFFQNLPDSLRQTILTDMEESQMASLPPDLAAEAQNLRREWESRNNSRLDSSQSNTLSGYISTRVPSTLHNVNDDSRWQMNSIWYDPNSTSPAQHNRNAAVVHQQQQIPGKPIALVLMEDEGNLLDPDSLTTILLLLFIEDSKSNLTRLQRVVRNLCYHVPTREWIINALISIIQKTNDTDINFCCKKGVRPQWLKLCVDAAFGYKSNIFVINQAKEQSSNNSTNAHQCININPQAAQIILKNCMDMLFVLAKHFPSSFLPFNRSHQNSEIKTVENNTLLDYSNSLPNADSTQNTAKNKTSSEKINQKIRSDSKISESTASEKKIDDTALDDCPSTSKAAAVRYQRKNNVSLKKKNEKGSHYATNSNNFWEVLLNIDLSTQQRLLNIHDFPLNSYPEWKWDVKSPEFLSFNDSPFAKLLEMLPYKGICRSPQLTDMLVKLLALLSSELPREDDIDEVDYERADSNVTLTEKKDDNLKTNIKNINCLRKGYTKRKHKIYSKNFSQLQLIIEVLTHQCGTTDGLDNISKLIVNFSQCSQSFNAILLQYLVSAILGLAKDVQYAIQNLLSEIQIDTFNNSDGTVCSYDISSQQGVMQDRFTSQNIIIAMPTNIKPSCKLQLPALKKLLSPISAQPYFLRTLKIYMQIQEVFNIHNESNTSNIENKKPTLSQIICLDNLWSTLSKCLVALENSKDEYAVLVLQPSVEAFFLIHASHKKKQTESSATELANNITANANVNPIQIKKEEVEGGKADVLHNSEGNDGIDTENDDNMVDLQLKTDRQKFLSFAEKHRKVLNQILRQSPTHLSDGPFAVLVDHTRILDFDVKRKFFQTELERIDEGVRREENTVSVRRVTVFEDSFRVLYRLGPEEWKNRFYVVFEDEEGQDAGGLLREWYVIISREIFNPMYALFCVSPGDRVTYMINPSSHANPNHLSYFKFVGRVIAKAIHDNKLLECYFTRSFYKHILGKQIKYTDMESQDYDFYKGLDYLMQHNISTLGYELTFSTEVQEFGVTQVRDLIPNGRNIAVTEENKFEYVQLVCQLKMSDSIRQQLDAFLEGFYDIIPKHLISIFNEQELELLISGLPDIDIEDLKANTEYHKYCSKSIQIQWFWRSLRSFDQADRAKFLQFVTGTSKVPLQGFSSLEGMNGIQKFQIHRDDRSTDRLPCAHTCFNQLDLPMYKSYEKLRSSLMKAIHECSEGFGFA